MRNKLFTFFCITFSALNCLLFSLTDVAADRNPIPELTREEIYQQQVRPFLKKFCYECHDDVDPEADIDLTVFTTTKDMGKHVKMWIKVGEMLDTRQMPPRKSDQPSNEQRELARQWVHDYLRSEAKARAGDPGKVLLRRLSNAEYTHTLQDLTGLTSLKPAHQFPVDGASGEGFTNTGSGLVMSPGLVKKYLNAAKRVSDHMVLLPEGIRFSNHVTQRDWTDESLNHIRQFYHRYTNAKGGTAVNLQGIRFETNQGGRLHVLPYLLATLEQREQLRNGETTLQQVARKRALNPKYLSILWEAMTNTTHKSSSLLDSFRKRWRLAKPTDAKALADYIVMWQKQLWKFNSIGHNVTEHSDQKWMEPVTPITERESFEFKMPISSKSNDTVLYLTAWDADDGNEGDAVVWENPRFVFKGKPPMFLRDIGILSGHLQAIRKRELAKTTLYLSAVIELHASGMKVEDIAKARKLNSNLLQSWANYASMGKQSKPTITGHFTNKLIKGQGHKEINGWGTGNTPLLLTNQSKAPIQLGTLTVPARGVTIHPSPTHEAIVSWKSPLDGRVQLEGKVADADNKCGNGAAWRLVSNTRLGVSVLASGIIDNGKASAFAPKMPVNVRAGDVISLIVNARDKSHSCDTTHIELKITETGNKRQVWDLASDIVDRVLISNPLSDRFGNEKTWHFCALASNLSQTKATNSIPAGSSFDQWRKAASQDKINHQQTNQWAAKVQQMLSLATSDSLEKPDAQLHKQLTKWSGPLQWTTIARNESTTSKQSSNYGITASKFGKLPSGKLINPANLSINAPQTLAVRLPLSLIAGSTFVTSGTLDASTGKEGSVQLSVSTTKPATATGPYVVLNESAKRKNIEESLKKFRDLFPAALCYTTIVPVDQVVTLTLFYREDTHLQRLMLNDAEKEKLDLMWDHLLFISQEPIKLVTVLEQLIQFATQDNPKGVIVFKKLEKPVQANADLFKKRLITSESNHLNAVMELANIAWRRQLSTTEQANVQNLYKQLRDHGLPHPKAIRLTFARLLTAPVFLYKIEQPGPGKEHSPASNEELATRLSYFLWSSLPDEELRGLVQAKKLSDPKILAQQARRMLKESQTRRLAIYFACQWLHIRDFDKHDDKNEKLYPNFAQLRGLMYEESVRFFEDMFRNDGSVLDMFAAKHTFLNETLAKHYSIEGVHGPHWRRVENVRATGRGGVLGMASVLATNSGASRTSPILRGNWVYETLLGERLPRPPANVPQLPEKIPTSLTSRQLIEKHSSSPLCSNCHKRIDPYGFALEQYDAIGRTRKQIVNTKTVLVTGKKLEGISGLRNYLVKDRINDVTQQFCRKFLGYALGREVQLSDELLLEKMQRNLKANDYRFSAAVETIVTSQPFRFIRGKDYHDD